MKSLPRLRALGLPFIAGLCLALVGCEPSSTAGPTEQTPTAPAVSAIKQQPMIRVRIDRNESQVRIESPGGLLVGAAPDGAGRQASAMTVTRAGGRFIAQPVGGIAQGWLTPSLWIAPASGATLAVNGTLYPGAIRLESAPAPGSGPGTAWPASFDVINHAPLEDYLPGVLQAELYQSWQLETFKAQAIAARSYALFEMNLARGRHFDVESTAASQAYAGATVHSRAAQAVHETRGVVLTSNGEILPAFFSSCCGGRTQYALGAIQHATDAPPINTDRPACTFCTQSNFYRWGPVTIARTTLAHRMAAWGRENRQPIAALADLVEIRVTLRTPSGRPRQFTMRDTRGQSFTLGAEEFRFACDFGTSTPLLRSSDVAPEVRGQSVVFSDGRGFGHGVGLCQFGAEGMAQRGYNAQTILGFYYPGSALEKIW